MGIQSVHASGWRGTHPQARGDHPRLDAFLFQRSSALVARTTRREGRQGMLKTNLRGCLEVLTYHYTEVAHVDVLLPITAQAPLQREKGLSDASSDLMRAHTGRSQALVPRQFSKGFRAQLRSNC